MRRRMGVGSVYHISKPEPPSVMQPLTSPHAILGLIDVQPDFMPGGALAIADGNAILPVLNHLLSLPAHAFATQDWHPPGHVSFASSHPGHAPFTEIALPAGPQTLWPDHCLQASAGAALHPQLAREKLQAVIRKGYRPSIDSYSAFFENDHTTPTGLHGYLAERGITQLYLAGLATDFCVAWSAEDAVRLGYQVAIISDACRAIALPLPEGGTTLSAAEHRLRAMGVCFVQSRDCR